MFFYISTFPIQLHVVQHCKNIFIQDFVSYLLIRLIEARNKPVCKIDKMFFHLNWVYPDAWSNLIKKPLVVSRWVRTRLWNEISAVLFIGPITNGLRMELTITWLVFTFDHRFSWCMEEIEQINWLITENRQILKLIHR